MRERRLIINADDFGLTAGINAGIAEAHEAGVVSSVSMMAHMPGWDDAVRRGRALGAHLSVGLHLRLTVGRPLTAARSLVDARTGAFRSLPAVAAQALAGRVSAREVAAECEAQIDCLRAAGLTVTHLDSHHHVHTLPGVWEATLASARAAGVDVVRVPIEPLAKNWRNWRRTCAKAALLVQWRLAARRTPGERPRVRFRGTSLTGGARFLRQAVALVRGLDAGTTELVVHPGYVDGVLPNGDRYTWQRESELRALTSREFRHAVERAGVVLTHFGDL